MYKCKSELVAKYLTKLEKEVRKHNLKSDEQSAFEEFKSLF